MDAINLSDKRTHYAFGGGKMNRPKKNRFVLHTPRLMNGVQKEMTGER